MKSNPIPVSFILALATGFGVLIATYYGRNASNSGSLTEYRYKWHQTGRVTETRRDERQTESACSYMELPEHRNKRWGLGEYAASVYAYAAAAQADTAEQDSVNPWS